LAQAGKRKRKQRHERGSGAAGAMARGYAKAEAKNAAVRAQLEPLAPGERPLPVTIGAIVAVALVVIQLPLYIAWNGDKRPALTGFLVFVALMLTMAWGMWHARYWAVLGFQALLALTVLTGALALMVAGNAVTVLICLAIILPAGALFWSMVKALARIQMPERRT
jgi:anti-sigma factor RsiW